MATSSANSTRPALASTRYWRAGAALEKFARMVAALGGAHDFVEHAAERLPVARAAAIARFEGRMDPSASPLATWASPASSWAADATRPRRRSMRASLHARRGSRRPDEAGGALAMGMPRARPTRRMSARCCKALFHRGCTPGALTHPRRTHRSPERMSNRTSSILGPAEDAGPPRALLPPVTCSCRGRHAGAAEPRSCRRPAPLPYNVVTVRPPAGHRLWIRGTRRRCCASKCERHAAGPACRRCASSSIREPISQPWSVTARSRHHPSLQRLSARPQDGSSRAAPSARRSTGSTAAIRDRADRHRLGRVHERFQVHRPGRPYGGGEGIFDAIAATGPDLMLWLGDNIYLRDPTYTSLEGIQPPLSVLSVPSGAAQALAGHAPRRDLGRSRLRSRRRRRLVREPRMDPGDVPPLLAHAVCPAARRHLRHGHPGRRGHLHAR